MEGQTLMLRTVDSEDRGAAKILTSQVIQQAQELLQPQPVQSEESSLDESGGGSPQRVEPPGRFLSAFSSPDDSQTFFSRVTSASSSGYSPQQSPLQSALHFSPVSTPSRGENLLPITPGSYSTDTSSLRSSTLSTTPNRPVSDSQQQLPLSYRTIVSMTTKNGEASPSKSNASPSISPRTRAARIAEATKFAKQRGQRRQLPSSTLQPKSSAKEQPGDQDDHTRLQKELQEQFEQEHKNEQQEMQEHLEFQEHLHAQFEQEQQQQQEQTQQDDQVQEQVHMDLDESYHEEPAQQHKNEQQEMQEHLEFQEHLQAQFEQEQQQQEQTQQDDQEQEQVHMDLDESYHEEPAQQQEQLPAEQPVQQQELHQKAQSQDQGHLPPHPNRAALPRSPSVEPPRASDQAPVLPARDAKTRRSKHSKNNNKSGSDAESDWSSDAIESVSSSVNMALDKLKAIAKPYMGQAVDDDNAPEVVNTSTEGSTEDARDNDTASECSGLDLKELERELRAKKPDEPEEQGETAPKNDDVEQRQVSRHESNNSFDTFGIPKPAILTHDPAMLRNLQKPVARSGGPPRASKARGHLSPRLMVGLSTAHNEKPNHSKGSDVGSTLSGSNGSSTSSMKASRAVTPIMRMRGKGGEQDAAAMSSTARKMAQPVIHDELPRSEQEHKVLKQKRWKEKMKLVERQREREKKLLNGGAAPQRRKKRSKSRRAQRDDASASTGSHKPFAAAFPACQNEITTMLEKFVRVRCGHLEDAFFEEDEDSDASTDGSEYETEDDGTDISADYTDNTDIEGSTTHTKTSVVDAGTMTSAVSKTSVTAGTMTSASTSFGFDTATTSTSIKPVVPTEQKTNGKSVLGIKDKNFIRAFISDATKNGFVLMLHEKDRKKCLSQPTKTTIFVKRGAPAANGHFVGPSLVWNNADGAEIGGVDLFDIRSLDKATALQLEDYPLAMPGRSLFLRMNRGTDYVFEAENEDDALRFVHGMRWVVARLSFNLIIGNLSVSCELLDVERSGDDENGKFPRTLKEESHWTMAMTDVTSHLVEKAAIL